MMMIEASFHVMFCIGTRILNDKNNFPSVDLENTSLHKTEDSHRSFPNYYKRQSLQSSYNKPICILKLP